MMRRREFIAPSPRKRRHATLIKLFTIVAVLSTPIAVEAQQTTQTVPIVMLPLGDPVGVGLVSNIARPEGNITGTTAMTSELSPKRLELLKDAAPSMSRVLVLSYLVDPIAPLQVKTLE